MLPLIFARIEFGVHPVVVIEPGILSLPGSDIRCAGKVLLQAHLRNHILKIYRSLHEIIVFKFPLQVNGKGIQADFADHPFQSDFHGS